MEGGVCMIWDILAENKWTIRISSMERISGILSIEFGIQEYTVL